MGKHVNQRELAEILGVSDVSLWDWSKEGMPIEAIGGRGHENVYDTASVIAWMIAREVRRTGGTNPRDELARLQAEKLRREFAAADLEMVPASQVEAAWNARVLAAAAFLISAPSRQAQELEALHGVEAKRNFLKTEHAAMLTHLGVNGERMQLAVDKLLANMSDDETAAFLRELSS